MGTEDLNKLVEGLIKKDKLDKVDKTDAIDAAAELTGTNKLFMEIKLYIVLKHLNQHKYSGSFKLSKYLEAFEGMTDIAKAILLPGNSPPRYLQALACRYYGWSGRVTNKLTTNISFKDGKKAGEHLDKIGSLKVETDKILQYNEEYIQILSFFTNMSSFSGSHIKILSDKSSGKELKIIKEISKTEEHVKHIMGYVDMQDTVQIHLRIPRALRDIMNDEAKTTGTSVRKIITHVLLDYYGKDYEEEI